MNTYSDSMSDDDSSTIAIIGMTGRFPDAPDLARFWRNLRDGVESVRPVSDDDLLRAGVDAAVLADQHYVKVASTLDGIDLFDADFFGMSPREAELMDPQHRLFMECAWEALEHAGYAPRSYPGAIGLFAGSAMSNYLVDNIVTNPEVVASAGIRQLMLVNDKDFLCGRVAYELNLRGPAMTVLTACSTSLVAVHMACQSILNGESDMALAGGVALSNLERTGYFYTEGGLYSSDGHCRAFDANATGIVAGSGLGIVVLKRLDRARADRDTIHAVIRGTAVNNDGRDKASFTAPSVDGQAAVIGEAQAVAGVAPDSIGYIEAHGTGTMLGDPIEMRALTQAFGAFTARKQFCAIGSLKTNLGHLDVAAGIAGLIKTALALKHGQLPPSLHFRQPNPHIDFAGSPFFVNASLADWPRGATPRRAGVSSFGIGGTNAHAILEEAPAAQASAPGRAAQLLVLSARSEQALDEAAANLATFLAAHPEADLADTAYTLLQGREHFAHRRSIACHDHAEAAAALRLPAPAAFASDKPPVVFMFPGGGTQYPGMGRELYESEAVYRAVIDECAALLQPHLGCDLRTVLYAPDGVEARAALDRTELALPALFATEYALVRQLDAWGVRPKAMIGHSLGEYVAACVAGVCSLADALAIVATRGRLIASLPSTNMLAVLLPAEAMRTRLGDGLWLACVNASESCTISGTRAATTALARELAAEGIEFQLLEGWPASHSGLMEPIVTQFRAALDGITLHAPRLPYLSNLSGGWITAEQATDPAYWVAHLCNTVCFADGLRVLLADTRRVFLEIGPGHTLSNLLRRETQGEAPRVALSSLPRRDAGGSALTAALAALGQMWCCGASIDWDAFHAGQLRQRIALPTYPFQRKRYWIAPGNRPVLAAASHAGVAPAAMAAPRPESPARRPASYARPALPTGFVAPQGDDEYTLCAIWEEILGVAPVGTHDDFFALGGNSLIAIQLASRLRARFGVEVPLRTLFRASTVAAQAGEIARAVTPPAAAIAPRASGVPVAPSFAQQRLCFIAKLDPAASAAYHIMKALRLTGPLDRTALQATLDRVVARHENLRTTFVDAGGTTVQAIAAPDAGFALQWHDLCHLAGHEQESGAMLIGTDEGAAPFDLATGPLIRGRLLQLAEDEHILYITQHHIISDGWSIGLLVREVGELYAAFAAGQPDPLPPLPIQYADYAAWQGAWLQGVILERQLAYWTGQLAGAPALLALPSDRPRPAVQSYAGGHVPITLTPALTQAVRALGQRHGATVFMTLLAAWSLLLARLAGQDDVVIGTPVANRQRAETENLTGFFVNTLALRVRFEDDPTVAALLAQVSATTLGGYEHQDLPFDQVVEALQPVRSTSHGPVFQAMLNLHNTPGDSAPSMAELTIGHVATADATAQCDLLLSIEDTGTCIAGTINYASALFDTATVQRIAGYFAVLLEAMTAAEGTRTSQLYFLTDFQREELLSRFNGTEVVFPADELIHQLFETHAAACPEALALTYEEQKISYAQLNRHANRIAHHLLALGVQPDDRVALLCKRGIDMVAGVLGILKAGAGYVPLDPAYPAERLAFMLSDSAPVALLTQHDLAASLPVAGLRTIVLDGAADMAALDARPDTNPDPAALGLESGHLAYVIYTSGSTGQPKGVMNLHRGLCNLARAQIGAFGLQDASRVLQFVSMSFDVCISEITMALCSGASLHLAPAAELLPGEPLLATLRAHRISHVSLPMAALAALPPDADVGQVHTLIVGGEALPPALARHWSARCAVFNSYGPTEATVCATVHRVDPADQYSTAGVPIGRPLANTRIYILDASGQLVPPGVAGEIHIGGVQVARGYLNRPALTAERFVETAFGRLYKTGDLGRWRGNGDIDYLGRNDFQVKIRGFRIEPGEIETRLAACDGVREALVLAREDVPGDKRLVAYVALKDGASVTPASLRAQLAVGLAEHMMPSAFVFVDAFPLTPNGKIDRKALPPPDGAAVVARQYEAPEGEIEFEIARIWQVLLGIERVGRHDHFFELGGYSLLATQFVARFQDAMGIDVPLMKVFQVPTLAALADDIVMAELKKFDPVDVADVMLDIDALSDEEVDQLLARERVQLH
jgi:amino acid adenylation domain-containing protein